MYFNTETNTLHMGDHLILQEGDHLILQEGDPRINVPEGTQLIYRSGNGLTGYSYHFVKLLEDVSWALWIGDDWAPFCSKNAHFDQILTQHGKTLVYDIRVNPNPKKLFNTETQKVFCAQLNVDYDHPKYVNVPEGAEIIASRPNSGKINFFKVENEALLKIYAGKWVYFKSAEHNPLKVLEKNGLVILHSEIATLTAGDPVNNPNHYTSGGIECLDAMQAMLSPEEFIGFLRGNIFKYQWRYKLKNGVEDLEKAQFYSKKLIEVEKNASN